MRCRRSTATAASPSAASATTSMSGWASRIIRKPARTKAWSSAITTRSGRSVTTGLCRTCFEGQPGADRVATAEPRPGLEPTAGMDGPLAHPDESAPGPSTLRRAIRRGGRTVVEDLDPELAASKVRWTSVRASRAYRSAFVSASWTIR